MSYQEAIRGLMRGKKGSAESRSTIQDWGMGLAALGQQIGRRDTAWDQAKKGYLQAGGTEANWEGVSKRPPWWKQLVQTVLPWGDKGIFQGPEGKVGISIDGTDPSTGGYKEYDLENLRKVGSFQELLGEDPSAYTGEGKSSFGTIMDEYTKTHAPGKLVAAPVRPNVPIAAEEGGDMPYTSAYEMPDANLFDSNAPRYSSSALEDINKRGALAQETQLKAYGRESIRGRKTDKGDLENIKWLSQYGGPDRPKVPIADEDEFFDEDITVEDTDFDEFGEWEEPVSLKQTYWDQYYGSGQPPTEEVLSEEPWGEGELEPYGETFLPKYDFVKPVGKSNRSYDLQQSLKWQNKLFNKERNKYGL